MELQRRPGRPPAVGSQRWVAPEGTDHPTGGELIERYLEPLALLPGLRVDVDPVLQAHEPWHR